MLPIGLSKTVVSTVDPFLQQLDKICNVVELSLLQHALLHHILIHDQLPMPQVV